MNSPAQPGRRSSIVSELRARGFDQTVRRGVYARVSCSQCEALVINGVATHEPGCPNALAACKGCDALIPVSVRYCPDCQ